MIDDIIRQRFEDAKDRIFASLDEMLERKLIALKRTIASDYFEELSEAFNPNRQKVGRIIKIRRRIRRDKKGKMVIQKNKRKSAIKGFRISGNKVVRVSAVSRMKKSRNLKKFWRSTGRSKLRRTLLKRKMSMNRRKAIGLK
jgi:hypothetical protein